MRDVTFITNVIAGGWHPDDRHTFLGGNEESLVLLAEALARAGYRVSLYTTLNSDVYDEDGVAWRHLDTFDPSVPRDVFISWKAREIWRRELPARLKIHASQDVEAPLPCTFNVLTTIGTYHASRLPWVPPDRVRYAPLGIDTTQYRRPEPDTVRAPLALYATSPDRGLETLLKDWPVIRAAHPGLSLLITYDWTRLATMSGPQGAAYAEHLGRLAQQPGITRACVSAAEMVRVFQRARYYLHPLSRPDADLYGFGALKAAACGCQLVLATSGDGTRPVSGFIDTVREWTPYAAFVRGETGVFTNPAWRQPALSWDAVVAQYWVPLLEGAS